MLFASASQWLLLASQMSLTDGRFGFISSHSVGAAVVIVPGTAESYDTSPGAKLAAEPAAKLAISARHTRSVAAFAFIAAMAHHKKK